MRRHRSSVFSQELDRASYLAYLLGAVVPLVALGFLAQRYVLPALDDQLAVAGIVGALLSICVLSLGAFFVLRRLMVGSLARMRSDNERLQELVRLSERLAHDHEGTDLVQETLRSVVRVTGAHGAALLLRAKSGDAPSLRDADGDEGRRLYQSQAGPLEEPVSLVLSEDRPVVWRPEAQGVSLAGAVVAPVEGEGAPAGALVALFRQGHEEGLRAANVDALGTLAGLLSIALRNRGLQDAQRNFFTHVTDLLVSALDSHTVEQAGHGKRVAAYSNRVGRALALDEERLARLHFAALLHDVGMLRIPREAQRSAKACEAHASIGHRMLARITLWQEVAPLVLHHHERFDGRGYPKGLAREEIPLEARILCVTDAFDAMTSPSAYREEVSTEEALRELEREAGHQFDPRVVDTFAGLVRSGGITRE